LSPALLQSTFEVIDLLNLVCQEGDSSGFKRQLREMTEGFESPIKLDDSGGRAPGKTASAAAGETTGPPSGHGGTEGTGAAFGPVETVGAEGAERDAPAAFEEWRPILTSFYTLEKHARSLSETGRAEGWEDLLLELGMAAIELRSAVDEAPEYLGRVAMYIEKFVSTVTREQIPYSGISYELLFTLLDDFRRAMWERLFSRGTISHVRVEHPDALGGLHDRIRENGVLYVVELAFGRETALRGAPFFERLKQFMDTAPERVILISPRMQVMRKATALLDQALEGYPQIASNIEEGVRTMLVTEE
jgi:hypothetical protein